MRHHPEGRLVYNHMQGVPLVQDTQEAGARRVLVLGAGYAGLTCFLTLQARLPRHCELTLVNLDRYHWFTTELHAYVAGAEADAIRLPLSRVVAPPARLVVGRVVQVEPDRKQVRFEGGEHLPYDLLVFALGSEPEYYGLPGVAEHSLEVGSWEGARRLRAAVRRLVTRNGGGEGPGRVVVAGGGLTGVELAGELADEFPGKLQVTVVEAGPEIMPGFAPELVQAARGILERKGVTILTGEPIAGADSQAVLLKSGGRIPYDLLVWAAGVRGSAVLAQSGLAVTPRGRAKVDAFLRAEGHPDIYVAGDSASVVNPATGREMPPSGQLAVQMGRAVARNILRRLQGRPQEAFQPKIRGIFASLGQWEGVGQMGQEQYVGAPAIVIKDLAEAQHVWAVGGGLMPLVRRLLRTPIRVLRKRPLYPQPASRRIGTAKGRHT